MSTLFIYKKLRFLKWLRERTKKSALKYPKNVLDIFQKNSPLNPKKVSVMTDTFFEKKSLEKLVLKGYGKIRVNQFK